MKKLKQISILAVILFGTILLVNCENENLETEEISLTPELIGKIHNEALDNILNKEKEFNFNTTENGLKNQIIEENNSFLKNRTKRGKPLNYSNDESVQLLNVDQLISKNLNTNYSSRNNRVFSMQESNIFEKINFIYEKDVILENDKKVIDELYDAYKENYQGILNDQELLNTARTIRDNYKTQNNDYSKQNVFVTLSILEICVNSLEWFDENMETLQNEASRRGNSERVLIWNVVGADAVGAIIGIGEAIIEHGVREGTTTPVDGESVVYSALWGAATTSVGSVVKVGSWISKLF